MPITANIRKIFSKANNNLIENIFYFDIETKPLSLIKQEIGMNQSSIFLLIIDICRYGLCNENVLPHPCFFKKVLLIFE